jgi:hypothetical protein
LHPRRHGLDLPAAGATKRQVRRVQSGLLALEPGLEIGRPQASPTREEDRRRQQGAGEGDRGGDPDRGFDPRRRLRADRLGDVEEQRRGEEGGDPAQQLDQRKSGSM